MEQSSLLRENGQPPARYLSTHQHIKATEINRYTIQSIHNDDDADDDQSDLEVVTLTQPCQRVDSFNHAECMDTYMTLSIVSTFFCCVFGILAIIFSCEAKDALSRGNIPRARNSSVTAWKFAAAAIATFLLCGFVTGILIFCEPLGILSRPDDPYPDVPSSGISRIHNNTLINEFIYAYTR